MSVPIHQVRIDGTVRQIGEWIGGERRLELSAPGFPLLGPGSHVIEGELPWVFWDMCPSGFLGRRFASVEPELQLNSDPRTWTASDALRALTEAGHDLAGNLIVGERSFERWRTEEPKSLKEVGVDDIIRSGERGGSSSLGGERPKIAYSSMLVKFSPPRASALGRRWRDLLRMEHLCSQSLSAAGVPTPVSVTRTNERTWLGIDRFDRLDSEHPQLGRRGAVTLYWLAMDRLGDVRIPAPKVVQLLVDEGNLPQTAFTIVDRVHAFSAAIGNNDAHLGNYGLTFDDEGRASLAPFYDILPMALAPAHDELPDARLQPRKQPIREDVRELVNDLVKRAEADPEISREFLDLWRRYIGV